MSFELQKVAAAAVLLAAASWSVGAHAATQSTSAPSLFPNASFANVTLTPVSAVENSPVHFYLSGYIGGYARCNDPAGCGAVTIDSGIGVSFSTATGLSYYADLHAGQQSYGPSEYGDFIDFTPVKFSSQVLTLSYSEAVSYGLVNIDGTQPTVQAKLQLAGGFVGFPGASANFDILDVALLTPKINLHYVADPNAPTWNPSPVPEPSTAVMGLLGLAAIAGLVRRRTGA